ncbi:MAG: hypothetical protein KDK70_40230, partial [Myxococcales bacterium]|nr:hypothetical protein [Myxococcales bacterium]
MLVALREEFRELLCVAGGSYGARPNETYGGDDYLLSVDDGRGGSYRVLAFFMDDMGPSAATHAAERLLAPEPAIVVNVGIACSLDAEDLRLCDVVV